MHRPSNRLALKRKSTRRVVRTTGFPFKLKRVFPWGLLINSFVRYNWYTSVETANKSWNLICGSDRKRPKKTNQEDGHGKESGETKDQENQNIQLLPTYTKNPTTRRKKLIRNFEHTAKCELQLNNSPPSNPPHITGTQLVWGPSGSPNTERSHSESFCKENGSTNHINKNV